jgi:pimeloyl-ACP methyl ester carboxylesterase
MERARINGVELAYELLGAGAPIVMIHGAQGDQSMFAAMAKEFAAGYRVLTFDQRGSGLSEKPDTPYSMAMFADDTAALMDHLKMSPAHIIGVSMGGMIAQELTLRHPEQVAKVVLGCTTPGGPNAKMAAPEVVTKLVEGTKLMASNPEQGLDIILPLLYPEEFAKAHPEIKQLMLAGMKMMPPTPTDSVDRTVAGIMTFSAYDRLGQIKCPVLIVHGDKDLLIPIENAQLLKSRIPQAEVFMIPNAGHAFQAADPIGIHQRIVQFLKQ